MRYIFLEWSEELIHFKKGRSGKTHSARQIKLFTVIAVSRPSLYVALQSNLIQTNLIQAIKFDDSATSKTN